MSKQVIPTNHVKPSIQKIGLFDSGQGGLGTWNLVRKNFPALSTVYLGDNARYPYGTKSNPTVKRYATEAILALADLGAEAVIVACGTASCVAVPGLSGIFKLPVLGIVDGMCSQTDELVTRLCGSGSGSKEIEDLTVSILGTPYSISSGRIDHALSPMMQRIPQVKLWKKPCPLFVSIVEEGLTDDPLALSVVEHYLKQISMDTRVVMLACTHFPHLVPAIQKFLSKKLNKKVSVYNGKQTPIDFETVYLVDPAIAMTHSLPDFLSLPDQSSPSASTHEIFCTDDQTGFSFTGQRFCDVSLPSATKISIGH